MHQLTFSSQSNRVLKYMSQEQQMQLIDFLGSFDLEKASNFGKIVRGAKTYYRLRWNEFRIYLEALEEGTFVIHYLIAKHTWNDFLFRTNLPFNEEMIEKDNQFWQYLENLKK